MRKVCVIALNTLRQASRDRRGLSLMLLTPMVLIGILGVALKGLMGSGQIRPSAVLVVNEDRPASPALPPGAPESARAQLPVFHFGRTFIDEVLNSEDVRRLLSAAAASDLVQAQAEVAAGKAVAVIHIPASFTADLLTGQKASMHLYTDRGRPTQAEIVRQVVNGFTESLTANLLNAQNRAGAPQPPSTPVLKEVPSGNQPVGAMQYYAAATSIMFMVMAAFTRAQRLLEEQRNGTLARTLVSPTTKAVWLAGSLLGSLAVLLAQFMLLMLGTHLFYGVEWGTWWASLLVGCTFALAAAGIGTAAAGLMNDPRAVDSATGIITMLFGSLSGGMFPLYAFPDTLRVVAKMIPNYWALQGFLDQMAGLGIQNLWLPVGILALTGIATGALGAWRLASK